MVVVMEWQRMRGGMWNGNGFGNGELFGQLVCVVWGGVRSWLMGAVILSFLFSAA